MECRKIGGWDGRDIKSNGTRFTDDLVVGSVVYRLPPFDIYSHGGKEITVKDMKVSCESECIRVDWSKFSDSFYYTGRFAIPGIMTPPSSLSITFRWCLETVIITLSPQLPLSLTPYYQHHNHYHYHYHHHNHHPLTPTITTTIVPTTTYFDHRPFWV